MFLLKQHEYMYTATQFHHYLRTTTLVLQFFLFLIGEFVIKLSDYQQLSKLMASLA